MGFSNIILISNLKDQIGKKKQSIFFFKSTNIYFYKYFYRIEEHGTDRSAQILIFLFFIYILSLRGNYENFENILPKLMILWVLLFLLSFIFYI